MSVNDTLKFRSFGWKQDMETKKPHIDNLQQNGKQYFPPDSHGIVDEWKALIHHQAEIERRDEMRRADEAKK